jgi:protein-disulfide isomerase
MSKYLATAAGCANDQGQFWNMHDALFTKQPKSKAAVVSVAASLGLDVNKFMTCMDNSQAMMALIKRNIGIGRDLKLNGTPAFVLAVINPDGSALPKKYILGAQPLRVFDVAIADLRAR